MKNLIIKFILFGSLMLVVPSVIAQELDAKILRVINPSQSIGVNIGDVLHRKIDLEVKSPYQIAKNTLPVKGSSKNGVELVDVKVDSSKGGNKTIYKLNLSYQIFGYAAVPGVMQLPAEKLAITGGSQALSVNIPAWGFWFSPLVNSTIGRAKESMQPQQQPPLVDIASHQVRLTLYIGLLAIGLLGILYINADRRWLPFMGGYFAQAYRKLKRLSKTKNEEKTALFLMHQAFNKLYGANLFAQDVDQFLASHPNFSRLKSDIEAFFNKSNQSLFADQNHDGATFMNDLIALSRRLRDCERGV